MSSPPIVDPAPASPTATAALAEEVSNLDLTAALTPAGSADGKKKKKRRTGGRKGRKKPTGFEGMKVLRCTHKRVGSSNCS